MPEEEEEKECLAGSYYLKRAPESVHPEVFVYRFIMVLEHFMNISYARGVPDGLNLLVKHSLKAFG